MKLIFKTPKDKLPFAGVLFTNLREAERLNEDLVNKHKDCVYKAVFEPTGNTLKLTITCENLLLKAEYKDLEYNADRFRQWLYTADKRSFNFSHLIAINEQHTVVKTYGPRKNFVLMITRFEVQEAFN